MNHRGKNTRTIWIDAALGAVVVVVMAAIMVTVDFFDRFYRFTREHESWELDEFLLVLPVLVAVLAVYAVRRVLDLRREVALRTAAEARARDAEAAAVALHKVKEEFMATMSHELRTPLNGIMATLSLLQASPMDQEQKELVEVSLASGQNLNTLLDEVMEFSQLGGEGSLGDKDLYLPGAVLVSVYLMLHPLAVAKGLTMPEPDTSKLPDMLLGQEGAVRQVLLNLVGNAIKFTDKGRVDISAYHEQRGPHQGTLVLAVADTGPGISPEERDKIFEPYTQLDQSLRRKKSGIGLGLSLVKRIVDILEGAVEVESEPGKGSTFRVSLPASLPHE